MPTIPQVAVIGERPTHTPEGVEIPAGWPIHNAPRPLYGNLTWVQPQAPFRSFGWFFAATDPAAPDERDARYNAEYVEENRRLDARELVFVSDEAAYRRGVELLRERYGSRLPDFEAKVADPRYRESFVTRGLEALSIESDE